MNKFSLFLRYIIFCAFFAVGTTAMVLSFLVKPEMTDYLQSLAMLEKTNRDNDKIRDLIDQYKSQIVLIEREPNVLQRLQLLTLGQTSVRPDTAYPDDYNTQLAAAAKQIIDNSEPLDPNEQIPPWIQRSVYPRYRISLCLAGAGLILIAFMFFGGTKVLPHKKKGFYHR